MNCSVERAPGARVDGTVTEGLALPGLRGFPMERFRSAAPSIDEFIPDMTSGAGRMMGGFLRVLRTLASILVVSIVAGLVALMWPRQITQVGRTIVEAPGPTFGIGLLTVIAACALVIALLLTICLPPIVLLALGAAGLFGWASLGMLVGERFFKAINAPQSAPLWPAAVGTLIISAVSTGLGLLWCLGIISGIATFVAGCFGLGAVVLTRFGARRYAPVHRAVVPPQPPMPAPSTNVNDESNAELPFRPDDPEV
ncbi:MAG: hypothetical protein GX601_15695, partial [Anaerolineales bacterium]|nr:hypothetical protein [Anaerolineales bacterium]